MSATNIISSGVTSISLPAGGAADGAARSAGGDGLFAAILGQQAAGLTTMADPTAPAKWNSRDLRPCCSMLTSMATESGRAGGDNGVAFQEGGLAALLPWFLSAGQAATTPGAGSETASARRDTDDLLPALTDPALLLLAAPATAMQTPGSQGTDAAADGLGVKSGPAFADLIAGQGTSARQVDLPAARAQILPEARFVMPEATEPALRQAATNPAILAATPELAGEHAVAADSGVAEVAAAGHDLSVAALTMATHAVATQEARAAIIARAVETPVGAGGWDGEIGDHMIWMAGNQQNRAELVLTPPHLGRIEISLSVTGDQASAIFISANPEVRESLEGALPRLREILADAGITLGQAQVGSESPGQRQGGDNPGRGNSMADGSGQGQGTVASARSDVHWLKSGRGLVDVFA